MARRISILTAGTLGDVSPLAVLGRALQQEGYEVSVAAPENFKGFIEGFGLEARRCGTDFQEFMRGKEMTSLAGATTVALVKSWLRPGPEFRAMFEAILRDAVAASRDADAILFHPFVSIAADIAEAKKIPAILVPLAMIAPSAEHPLSVVPGTGNRMWNRFGNSLLLLQRPAYRSVVNDLRANTLKTGKGPLAKHPHKVSGKRVPAIYPVSPVLRPGPELANIHYTGYWFDDGDPAWKPDEKLSEFLSGKQKPIYIGFGSMPGLGPDRTGAVIAACKAAGLRAIIGNGWASFAGVELTPNFFMLKHAPHQRLFREVAAVVHHGGLGTTSAGLKCGRPTLVCHFMLDQKNWGHRVWELGAGPEPIAIGDITTEKMAPVLRDLVSNPVYAIRGREIAIEMRDEDGPREGVKIVRKIIGSP